MYWVYNLILRCGALLAAPWVIGVLPFLPKWRRGFWARLGFYSRDLRESLADLPRPRVWFHASSVGELSAVAPIAASLKERHPNLAVVVSTMTQNGYRLIEEKIPAMSQKMLAPLDFPGAVKRALRAVEPDILVIAETEIWPNLLRQAKRFGCQLALVNGRMSEKSFRGYARLGVWLRDVLDRFDVLAMQSEGDAERYLKLGANAQRVKITGNAKFDAVSADISRELSSELRLSRERPVWVAGSTRPGEEEIILDAFALVRAEVPDAVLILAPRHLERLGEVEKMLTARRLDFTTRSRVPTELLDFPIVLLDTLGELAKIYGLGRVAFVGGSLVPLGGHNPLEPAGLGVPVLFGPHTEHFTKAAEILLERGAAGVVHNTVDLAAAVVFFLRDPEASRRRGEAAQQAVASHRGAAGQTATLLQKLMLIKRWGSEVKNWRSETLSGASSKPSGNPSGMLDDWPEWPL
ncbi:MAG: 3-deoxy-D-manno-octulosonic acid transferase [Candidatus Firestonebacteria bacterium]|nr:3-deoxy-D-manno-octulosonic acid transferase [Candidatus Firestonebacteria bacterium]